MYEKYFQLRERPFSLSPDPEYLYPSKVHQEALSYLRYGIEGHAGFVVITGEIGSGKTTMLQSLLGRLDRNTTVARIVNTMLDPRELLETIMLDFDMDPTGLSKPVLLRRLADFLVRQRQAGRLTLLVIDEAQNLSLPALEEVRMLSNLETEKSKLIQIVMIGQPELREKLSLPQLEQLRQRITVSYHLQPLDADETANYINHRLKRAALGPPLEFPRRVTALVHSRSRGVPRIINVIADATLLFAYGVDRRDIEVDVVTEALAELDATGVLASYQTESGSAAVSTSVSMAEAEAALRAAAGVREREQAMVQRERQLAERERAIAAQQRVVEEEARLLAAARSSSARASAAPATARLFAPIGEARIAVTHDTAVAPTAAALAAPAIKPVVAPTSEDPLALSTGTESAPATPRLIAPAGEAKIAPVTQPAHAPTDRRGLAPTHARVVVPTTPRAAVPPSGVAVAPAQRRIEPRTAAQSGVWVQRYQEPVPRQREGFWPRVRRVLFGEPNVNAN